MAPIIVGMDESEQAAGALRWAVEEGERRGWPVRAVLAWSFLRQHHVDRSSTHDPTYDDESAALALRAYVDDALGDTPAAAAVELATACDLPGAALVAASADAALLVVGSHGYGGIAGLVMGSVSQHCLHRAECPVVILGGAADREVRAGKVVVGVDGSETSQRALAWALDEARARSGWVEVVHSWMLPAAYGYATLAVPDLGVYEEAAEALVDRMIDDADTSGLSRPVSRVVVGGTSTAGLVAARADDAEILVVGSRGIGGFAGMVVGSVAHHLAHHAPCPVVFIPAVSAS